MRASSLDYLEIAKPQVIVYASRAPSWRYLDPDIPAFPEMPPRAPKDWAEGLASGAESVNGAPQLLEWGGVQP